MACRFNVGKEMSLNKGLSQITINRAVNIIGSHSDEIIVKLWGGLDLRYHFENTDVNIDESATDIKAESGFNRLVFV